MHLVILWGPPAVGKMTIGRRVAARTTYRLFHNHATIDPLLEVFTWDEPAFQKLKGEFRHRVIEEAIAADLPGLLFTVVWALDMPEDAVAIEKLYRPVLEAGGEVTFVELWVDLETRLAREGTEERLASKPSKRDVEWARANSLDWEERHVMSTGPDQPFPLDRPNHRIDTTGLSAEQAAEEIVRLLGLPTT